MLNARLHPLALVLALLLSGCPAIPVTPDPNEEIARAQRSLVLINTGETPIQLVPPPEAPGGSREVVLQPGESQVLPLTLRLSRNVGSGVREVLLMPGASSPFVAQSSIDLVVRARFGAGSVRELRVALGECVFDEEAVSEELLIELTTPPLPGIPVARLCPEPE